MVLLSPVLAALLACGTEPDDPPTDAQPETETGDSGTPVTGDDTGTTTETTSRPSGCALEVDQGVMSFTATPGRISTSVEFSVELRKPAMAAVRCIADDDPLEISLVESEAPATLHTLRISGLLPATDYTCTTAPTCPTMLSAASSLSLGTSPPPFDLRPLQVELNPLLGQTGAWTMASYWLNAVQPNQAYVVVWDPAGRARWWLPLPTGVGAQVEARYDAALDAVVWGGGMHPEGRPHIVDLEEGDRYVWAPAGWTTTEFRHDGKLLDDGRLLSLELREDTDGSDTWDGFAVRVHDPLTGVVDIDVDSQSLLDAGMLLPPADEADDDPWGANWADLSHPPEGPELVVSLCNSEQIVAIDATTGEAAWVLGRGLGWTVLDELGAPLPEDALPQCQHGIEVDDTRTLLVYDNGRGRQQSTAEEWVIDPYAQTAQLTWYWSEEGWAMPNLGDIDDLGNDRLLITQASSSEVSQVVEVDRISGQVASRLALTVGGHLNRAERYDGCALFQSVALCSTLASRHTELSDLLLP